MLAGSPVFAPQVAKVLAPETWLTVEQVAAALAAVPPVAVAVSGTTSTAVRIGPRTAAVLALASVAGVMLFCWPLFVKVDAGSTGHLSDAPFVFVALLPLLVVVVLASFADGGMDAKALAMLGVLSALNAALRPLGAGTAGIETGLLPAGPGGPGLRAGLRLRAGLAPRCSRRRCSPPASDRGCRSRCSRRRWIGLGAGLLPRRVRGRAEVADARGVRRRRRPTCSGS